MPIPKPAGHIEWVPDENPAKTLEPTVPKKALGFVADERPSPLAHNWLWARIGNWLEYFESATDELFTSVEAYQAVVGVGPTATHATLQEAINDAAVGWRIFVKDSDTINTRIGINKSDIEIIFKPGVGYIKGTETVGFEISGVRVKIRGGRFVSFNTAGDIVFKYLSGANFCHLLESIFTTGTDSELDDSAVAAGKKPVVLGTITES